MSVPQSRQGTSRRDAKAASAEAGAETTAVVAKPDNSETQQSSLTTGEYNEDEAHEGFLEALNAWRSAGKGGEAPDQQVMQIEPGQESPEQKKKQVTFNDEENKVASIEEL